MKLVQLGDTDAAACVDGVCEIPPARLDARAASTSAVSLASAAEDKN
jgi:hypothetical protein